MFTKTSLALALGASCAYAAFVPPARLDVPLILSSGGRPMLSVGMGTTGAGQVQHFNFTLTTSFGYSAVAQKGCSDCSDTSTYDLSLSPDARSLSGQSAMALGAGNFSGGLIKENCSLATQQGAPWSYTNQTVILMNNQSGSSPFESGVSGLFGLGTLKNPTTAAGFAANFDDGIYGQYYIRNPGASNFTFGMALKPSPVIPGNSTTGSLTIPPGAQSLADSDVGTLNWLQPDSSAYNQDQMVSRPVQSNINSGYLAGNEQPDWTVQLDGWTATTSSGTFQSPASIYVNPDPYYSGIYLPGQQARIIHDAISGSQQVSKSTIMGQTNAWEVPCDSKLTFTVNVDSQTFPVDESTLIVNQGDGTCISIIEGFTDSSVTQYIFGQNWLAQLYVIFNIPKDSDPQITFSQRAASTKSRDIGAIVGGVVGGVAGVVAIGLLAFYLIRRRQDNSFFERAAALQEEHKVASTVEPYILGSDASRRDTTVYSVSNYPSPPVSPHAPLLDADPAHLPPSYEEASESGASSSRAYPREKMNYRQDTMMTISEGPSAPVTPNNQTTFSSSSKTSS